MDAGLGLCIISGLVLLALIVTEPKVTSGVELKGASTNFGVTYSTNLSDFTTLFAGGVIVI